MLFDWKAAFLANAATVFQSDARLLEAEQRIAELEREISRQTMGSAFLGSLFSHCLMAEVGLNF